MPPRAMWLFLLCAPILVIGPASGSETPSGRDTPSGNLLSQLDIAALEAYRTSQPVDGSLILEAWRNGRNTGDVIRLQQKEGGLFITLEDLAGLGVTRETLNTLIVPGGSVALSETSHFLEYRIDQANQQIHFTIAPGARPLQRLGYATPEPVTAHRATGLVFNYDVFGRVEDSDSFVSSLFESRLFGHWGALENTSVTRAGDSTDSGTLRLETRWTIASSHALQRWTVGDLVTMPSSWSRSLRLGGIQWRRDYTTRPNLVTFPLPTLRTAAVMPSSLDLFIEGVKQYETDLESGPVLLDTLPRINGAGDMTIVVEDILGRQTVTTIPFYADNSLLAEGMSDYSLEAGFIREAFNVESNEYGDDLAGSGFYRRGLSQRLTVEAQAQATADFVQAGFGGVWLASPRVGIFNLSLGGSDYDGLSGSIARIGYDFRTRLFGATLQTEYRTEEFRDLSDIALASFYDSRFALVRSQVAASLFRRVGRNTFSMAYVATRRWSEDKLDRLNLNWRTTLQNGLSVSTDFFRDTGGRYGGSVYFNYALGQRATAAGGIRHSEDTTSYQASIDRRNDFSGGLGWNAVARQVEGPGADTSAMSANVNYLGDSGQLGLGVDHFEDQTALRLQAQGGLAVLDSALFASRSIRDSFAVVSAGGLSGVPVYTENRLLGYTRADGKALVPNLRGWQENRLSINPGSLPVEATLKTTNLTTIPADRSGVLVEFPLTVRQTVRLQMLDPTGVPLAAGTRLVGPDAAPAILVGFDGEVFIDNIKAYPWLERRHSDSRCRFHLGGVDPTSLSLGWPEPVTCERVQ